MKSKLFRRALVCLLLLSVLACPAAAVTAGGGTVTADGLNLRAAPSTDAAIRVVIPSDAFLLVEGTADNWCKVLYQGMEGYVCSDYLSRSETMDGAYGSGRVSGNGVRLRAAASLSGGVLGYLNAGTTLTVTGVSGEWLKVRTANGTEGYISSAYVTCADSASAAALDSLTLGEQIAQTAQNYLGYRYVYGGMSESGFDCSGFVNYVYKLYGYSMSRVAQDIYWNDGSYVDKADLQPGDLVFFGWSAYSIGHVGMYIGDGQFIHASTSTTGVIITELDSSYYTGRYVGAKRIV